MFAEGFRTLAPAPMLCPMFIRRTRTRTGERGEVYYSHRLVRSERSGEKVRQRTLLNLGSDFPVERRHWAVLCSRIQQLLDRQAELVPLSCPEEVERHAQRIAAQLLNSAPSGGTGRPDLQTVDVGSLELIRPRSVGVEHVGLWAMERLGLEALLERLGFNGTQRALAMASVIARMAAPGSERASWRWLCERSALGELLGVDFERMSMMRLYRVSDALMAQRAAIEAHLFDRATDLFGLRSTVTLYDLTNTFFEGEAAAQSKARRGHSKEKRSDCPLLTLGLVLDGSGFVRRSEVFSGAVNEDKTLASMLEALGAPSDALVVMDAGISHRGQHRLAARERLPLSGGQPGTQARPPQTGSTRARIVQTLPSARPNRSLAHSRRICGDVRACWPPTIMSRTRRCRTPSRSAKPPPKANANAAISRHTVVTWLSARRTKVNARVGMGPSRCSAAPRRQYERAGRLGSRHQGDLVEQPATHAERETGMADIAEAENAELVQRAANIGGLHVLQVRVVPMDEGAIDGIVDAARRAQAERIPVPGEQRRLHRQDEHAELGLAGRRIDAR